VDEPQNDPEKPLFVWARRPVVAPEWVYLYAHPTTLGKWLSMGSMAKLGEYMGLVHGRFPLSEGKDFPSGTTGLMRPTRMFRGLKRPLNDGIANADSEVVVYVTNPPRNYRWIRGIKEDLIREAPIPSNSVFTTFVSFRPELIDAVRQNVRDGLPNTVQGIVLHWEWTEASQKNPRLPYDFEQRYEEPLP
jgi:hypothetical protein